MKIKRSKRGILTENPIVAVEWSNGWMIDIPYVQIINCINSPRKLGEKILRELSTSSYAIASRFKKNGKYILFYSNSSLLCKIQIDEFDRIKSANKRFRSHILGELLIRLWRNSQYGDTTEYTIYNGQLAPLLHIKPKEVHKEIELWFFISQSI